MIVAEFINTLDVLGDDAVIDGIIDKSIPEFKDNKLTKIPSYGFYGCTALAEVDLTNVTEVGQQSFDGCTALERVNLPKLTSLTDWHYWAFRNCTSLREVNMPLLDRLGRGTNNNACSYFENCASLERITLPKCKYVGRGCFQNCAKLAYVDLGECVSIWGFAFGGCTSLINMIIRTGSVCQAAYSASVIFSNTPIASGNGYIYVPRALVDSYKAATNWSVYAAQFRALEDYTVDGTTTGELDKTKI